MLQKACMTLRKYERVAMVACAPNRSPRGPQYKTGHDNHPRKPKILRMAARQGPIALPCMPNRNDCMLLVSLMHRAGWRCGLRMRWISWQHLA
jgi:hypothetical protein